MSESVDQICVVLVIYLFSNSVLNSVSQSVSRLVFHFLSQLADLFIILSVSKFIAFSIGC